MPQMSKGYTFLVIADESAEFPAALYFAAWRAKVTAGRLVVLRLVDAAIDHTHWVSVSEEIRAEAWEAAEAFAARIAADVLAEVGLAPDIVIREGELKAELKALLDEDSDIRIIVLAAGVSREGPGPLVSLLARGQGLGGRALPVVVVPGGLSRDELKALALPDSGA
jgi:hypothetical protein